MFASTTNVTSSAKPIRVAPFPGAFGGRRSSYKMFHGVSSRTEFHGTPLLFEMRVTKNESLYVTIKKSENGIRSKQYC